jgi:hypothetical protein
MDGSDMNRNAVTATEPLLTYAAKVAGLLRDLAERMRSISELVEAGDLTQLQGQALKLETARAMVARLETVTAVYQSMISTDGEHADADAQPVASAGSTKASPDVLLPKKRTVSVGELLRESLDVRSNEYRDCQIKGGATKRTGRLR